MEHAEEGRRELGIYRFNRIDELGLDVVIAGVSTNSCVETTARYGFYAELEERGSSWRFESSLRHHLKPYPQTRAVGERRGGSRLDRTGVPGLRGCNVA